MRHLARELTRGAVGSITELGRYTLFTGRLLAETPRSLLRPGLVVEQVYNTGALSLVIIMLSGLFVPLHSTSSHGRTRPPLVSPASTTAWI